MAISTRKKNIIVAAWKTGEFKSFTSIAKEYKISTKTAQKIIGDTSHEHADIVQKGVEYQAVLKSTKNPHEVRMIEKVVDDRLKHSEIINTITEKNLKHMAKKIGSDTTISEHKMIGETTDKAAITLGVAERHAKSVTAVQVNNEVVVKTMNDLYEAE